MLEAQRFRRGEALSQGVHSSGVILNILARRKDPGPAVTIGAGGFHRREPVDERGRKDRYHLPVAVIRTAQFLPHPLQR